MRNSLLTTVAAAALSLAAAGAIAQEGQRDHDAAKPGVSGPGASSEAPKGKSENRSERANPRAADRAGGAQGERASGGKAHGAASEDHTNKAPESRTGSAQEKSSSHERASAQEKSSGHGKSTAHDKSTAQDKSSSQDKSSAQSAGSDTKSLTTSTSKKTSAQRDESRSGSHDTADKSSSGGHDRSGKSAAETSTEKSGSASTSTKGASQRSADQKDKSSSATRASSKSDRNLSGGADRDRSGKRNEDAASTRTGSDMNRSASRDRNDRDNADTNIQVRGEFHVDRDKAERVHDRLIRESGSRDRDINITVDIGRRLPNRVHLRPIPRDIVEISPRYRNYEYVVVHDEIVIVEPKTKKVVQIIAKGGGHGGKSSRHTTVSLNDHQRNLLRRDIVKSRTSRDIDLDIDLRPGVKLPDRITLQTFPTEVWEEVPVIKPYRYVVYEREILLVDPDTREVVEIIR